MTFISKGHILVKLQNVLGTYTLKVRAQKR